MNQPNNNKETHRVFSSDAFKRARRIDDEVSKITLSATPEWDQAKQMGYTPITDIWEKLSVCDVLLSPESVIEMAGSYLAEFVSDISSNVGQYAELLLVFKHKHQSHANSRPILSDVYKRIGEASLVVIETLHERGYASDDDIKYIHDLLDIKK